MILRLVQGRLLAGDAVRVLRRLGEAQRDSPAAMVEHASGFRDEGDRWAVLAASVWTDMGALEAHLAGPDAGFGPLPGAAPQASEHYELVEGDPATGAYGGADGGAGALGLLSAVVLPGREPEATRMVEETRRGLADQGVMRMYVGRSLADETMRLAVLALWRDRGAMRDFLRSRSETAIDPAFVRLTGRWSFETYDTFDPLRDVPAHASLAVLVADEQGRLVDASEGVERVLGMPPELLIGRPLVDWVAEDMRDELRARLGTLRAPGAYAGEVEFRRPDGSRVHVRLEARGGFPGPGLASAVIAGPADRIPTVAAFEDEVRAALAAAAGHPATVQPAPRLIAIPSTDLLFARFVERVSGTLGSDSPRRLTLHLRALYPRLAIHRRDLADERGETWYVFRDGRLTPRLPVEWWLDPSLPRVLVDRRGEIDEADAAARELFQIEDGRRVDLADLAPPGMADDVRLMLELTRSISSFDTVLALRALTDDPRLVAIHGEVTTSGCTLTVTPVVPPADGVQLAPVCLPAWDDMFIERVERIAETLAGQNVPVAAARLEARLRERFPSAVVRIATRPEGFGAEAAILLVYRDGDLSPYAQDRWWEDPSAARIVALGSRYVEANEAALALHGTTRAELLAATLEEFEAPEVVDDARWLRDILVRTGQLHATTWLRRRDGSRIPIEVHSELRPDGMTETLLRELAPGVAPTA